MSSRSTVTTWSLDQQIISNNPESGGNLGADVSISGNAAVVGAEYYSAPAYPDLRVIRLYNQSGSPWTEQVPVSHNHNVNSFGRRMDLAATDSGFDEVAVRIDRAK